MSFGLKRKAERGDLKREIYNLLLTGPCKSKSEPWNRGRRFGFHPRTVEEIERVLGSTHASGERGVRQALDRGERGPLARMGSEIFLRASQNREFDEKPFLRFRAREEERAERWTLAIRDFYAHWALEPLMIEQKRPTIRALGAAYPVMLPADPPPDWVMTYPGGARGFRKWLKYEAMERQVAVMGSAASRTARRHVALNLKGIPVSGRNYEPIGTEPIGVLASLWSARLPGALTVERERVEREANATIARIVRQEMKQQIATGPRNERI